jgi:hypothetical protein
MFPKLGKPTFCFLDGTCDSIESADLLANGFGYNYETAGLPGYPRHECPQKSVIIYSEK